MEERLINLVRDNELLYDKNNENYRNHQLREKKWREIAAILNMDLLRVKARWKSLRDRFLREKMKLRTLIGTGKKPPMWKFYRSMDFLKGHTSIKIKFNDCDTVEEHEQSYCEESPSISFEYKADFVEPSASSPTEMQNYDTEDDRQRVKDTLAKKIEEQLERFSSLISKGSHLDRDTPVKAFFYAMAIEVEHARLPVSTWFALQREIMQLITTTISALHPE